MEEWRSRIKQREFLIHEIGVELGHYHDQDVDDYYVLHGCRYVAHKASSGTSAVILVVTHVKNVFLGPQ